MKFVPQSFMFSSSNARKRILILLLFLLSLVSAIAYLHYSPFKMKATLKEGKEPWITIFVHGSFGTVLGLFSFFKVVNDAVDNTHYKRLTSSMRYDPYFYQLQPLREPGLFSFTPTFQPLTANETYRYAMFPIASAYKHFQEYVKKNENEFYYTFGWSGLISQQRRRKEAIRFYNILIEEIEKYKKEGITPKVRIITHSHGGNVALNMGGVHYLLSHNNILPEETTAPEEKASLSLLKHMLEKLPSKKEAEHNLHQKKWDYYPLHHDLVIDELILLGTPIQPETSYFAHYPFFKKIINVYSENDAIQGMDWVSTARSYSEQRFTLPPVEERKNTIIQARIMIDKSKKTLTPSSSHASEEPKSWWQTLLFSSKKEKSIDPTHKELWFMSWKREGDEKSSGAQEYIKPYPYVITIPLLLALLEKEPHTQDVDFHLRFKKGEGIKASIAPHGKGEKIKRIYFPKTVLEELQRHAEAWHPQDVTRQKEFSILHHYSSMLNA